MTLTQTALNIPISSYTPAIQFLDVADSSLVFLPGCEWVDRRLLPNNFMFVANTDTSNATMLSIDLKMPMWIGWKGVLASFSTGEPRSIDYGTYRNWRNLSDIGNIITNKGNEQSHFSSLDAALASYPDIVARITDYEWQDGELHCKYFGHAKNLEDRTHALNSYPSGGSTTLQPANSASLIIGCRFENNITGGSKE